MRKKFEITVLSDNRKLNETLESEHGLCVCLDTGELKVLLDTGASGLFITNAEQLGIDINEIDYVFISHGHEDHIGGLIPFLETNTKAKIILSKRALNQHFLSNRNGSKNIGIDFETGKYSERFVFIEKETHFGDICVFPCDLKTFLKPKANSTLYMDSGKGLELDNFSHELVFCCGTEDLFVYTGCAHKGLLNILGSVKQITEKIPEIVFGGFHLLDSRSEKVYETESEIVWIGKYLRENYSDTRFFTGHCTGDLAFELLKKELNQQIELFFTGFKTQL